jgi:hypothetical protein
VVAKRRLRLKADQVDSLSRSDLVFATITQHCPLCDRELVKGASIDEHHLVPKAEGGRVKELVHRICHRKIHATLSERELATAYSSWEALKAHPDLATFIQWVKKKPAVFMDNSRKTNRLKY